MKNLNKPCVGEQHICCEKKERRKRDYIVTTNNGIKITDDGKLNDVGYIFLTSYFTTRHRISCE